MSRAQSSIEAAFIITFMILVLITFVGIMAKRMIETQHENQLDSLEKVGQLLKNEMVLASRVQSGYRREFSVPVKVSGLSYNVTLINSSKLMANYSEVVLQSTSVKDFSAVELLPENVTGWVCVGPNKTNIIVKEEYWIRVRCQN